MDDRLDANRVRMVVASFLIKHLLIDWRAGEAWFWDTLVDADPANNAASWQWWPAAAPTPRRISASSIRSRRAEVRSGRRTCGAGARASGLDNASIHAPWEASPLERDAAGVRLGVDARRRVDMRARARALDALAALPKRR